MFKKGDKVKCIDDFISGDAVISKGREYIILEDDEDGFWLRDDCDDSEPISKDDENLFELIKQEEKPQIKVNDLIKDGTLTIDSSQEEKEASKVGLRFNNDKLPLDQIPPSMEKAFAEVARYGEKKYCKHNWRKGMDWSVPYACAKRHMNAWFNGEELDTGGENPDDKGSGLPHLYHALWNIAALIEYQEKETGLDDRWHKSNPLKKED